MKECFNNLQKHIKKVCYSPKTKNMLFVVCCVGIIILYDFGSLYYVKCI